jgi:hypothetical protein
MMITLERPKVTQTFMTASIINSDSELTDDSFLLYAASHYDKPSAYITSEFEDDLKRIQYLQKLFCRYKKKGELKERLILNHLIVLYNVFGAEPSVRILFLRISKEHWSALKTFLIYLNTMPDIVKSVSGSDIISATIPVDMNIAQSLRKI